MTHGNLLSMTGYGEAEGTTSAGRIRAQVRTVNHRFLNLQSRTPNGFDRHQADVERLLRTHFTRGHVSLTLAFERDAEGSEAPPPVVVDLERARGYRDALQGLMQELELGGSVQVQHLLHFRELFQPLDRERAPAPELEWGEVAPVLEAAATAAVDMRRTEGSRLAEDLLGRLQVMAAEVEAIEAAAPARLERERDRILEAVARLLPDGVPVDEERVAREIAHLAERWDIHEEMVRFRSHLAMFRDTLTGGSPDGVGKRLGFIVQEILREANTMGSKANDADIARAVVALKEEIERVREQVENVE
jgi:uncharacterized protein (TIGR00255 family)